MKVAGVAAPKARVARQAATGRAAPAPPKGGVVHRNKLS